MTVPGVSGGTMAVIVGIYEKLIEAINNFTQEPKKYGFFLLRFVVGAGAGFLIFAKGITYLLEAEHIGVLLRSLFCGIVAGGIPLLVKKSKVKGISIVNIMYVLIGGAIIMLLSALPQGMFDVDTVPLYIIMQLSAGIVVAIALILPGISVSHMLYVLGLYEMVLERVYTFKWVSLIPLIIGVIIGCIGTAKVLGKLMVQYTTMVYLIIIGFVAGSVVELIPKENGNLILEIGLFMVGCITMYIICDKES